MAVRARDARQAHAAGAAPRRSFASSAVLALAALLVLAGAVPLVLAATSVVTKAAPVASAAPVTKAVPAKASPTPVAAAVPWPKCPTKATTTPSGLQFCDLVQGKGKSPAAGSMIRAQYTGWLLNGKKFDSSYDRNTPFSFNVGAGQVIQGWDLGILGGKGIPPMKEGGKRLLTIPAGLAYGASGAAGVIPPNATLVFLVELLAPQVAG